MEHHAIIITGTQPGKLNREEMLVYTLVVGRVLKTFMPPCKMEYTAVDVVYAARKFHTRTYRILEKGQLGIFERGHLVAKSCTPYQVVSDLFREGILPMAGCSLIREESLPVSPYTDKELVDYMNKAGLDTVSTRANILHTLLKRKYIRYSGKCVVPTPKGPFLCETVRGMKIADTSLTSGRGTELARIERRELLQGEFLDDVLETVNEMTGEIFRNHPVEKQPQGTIQTSVKANKTRGVQTVCLYFFFICTRYIFPPLSGKGLGLPRFCRKAAPFGGLVG